MGLPLSGRKKCLFFLTVELNYRFQFAPNYPKDQKSNDRLLARGQQTKAGYYKLPCL